MKKIFTILLIATVSLLFAACTNSTPIVKSPSFTKGETDGCSTASGTYIKNSTAFRNNKEYADGWYYGRKNCNPAQSRT